MIYSKGPGKTREELINDALYRVEHHPPRPMWLDGYHREGIANSNVMVFLSCEQSMPYDDNAKRCAVEKLKHLLEIEQMRVKDLLGTEARGDLCS